jgi:hypothetical protein
MGGAREHDALLDGLTRRGLLGRSSAGAAALLVARALPVVALLELPAAARADATITDATLQAFADTMIPGRRAAVTESGAAIDPAAIAGVDSLPGAVEADALALYHHPEIGFDALTPAFFSDITTRSLAHGGDFLHLTFDARVEVCLAGLDFSNPERLLWEAAAAIPFTAFCAAALVPQQTADRAVGYRVMGLPGVAPAGYADYSYRRRLAREITSAGSLD